jgi:hypothetical protein
MRIDTLTYASFVDEALSRTKITLCRVKTHREDFKWPSSEFPPEVFAADYRDTAPATF